MPDTTTETTKPLDLDAIEAREKAATPGPYLTEWDSCDCGDGYGCSHGSWVQALRLPIAHTEREGEPKPWDFSYSEVSEFTPETVMFFAAARDDVPALVGEVRKLRAALDQLVDAAEDVLAEAEQAETDALFSGAAEPSCMRSAGMKKLREAINAIPANTIGTNEAVAL
jgi:hypothetical protein